MTCGQIEEPVEDSDGEISEEEEIEEMIEDETSCRSMKPVDLEDLGNALTKRNIFNFSSEKSRFKGVTVDQFKAKFGIIKTYCFGDFENPK